MIEGENITPLIESFEEMLIPEKIIKILKNNGIKKPTPIQM